MTGRAFALVVALAWSGAVPGFGQTGAADGEWRYWGGDAGSTRYSPLDQIDADNFGRLEVAWVWRGDNYGPEPGAMLRATPVYADGRLYTVAGARRTVVAIDPATGETLWMFREPPTKRWERSMRKNYGKGVAYGRDRRARRDLRGDAGLLPPRAGRRDGAAGRRLRRGRDGGPPGGLR
ncbi:MAG: hypothetical protein GWN02_02710, partial [Gemmatimonadetes bacterium]|nr:hypothetical protein [Gemmatimonadota bacterium]